MTHQPQSQAPAARPWKEPVERDYAIFLDQLSPKDRARVAKHEETSEASGRKVYGDLWKRLAGALAGLAPHATQFLGNDAVTFYIPDGKYKQQVFGLVQTKDSVTVFLPDVIEAAIHRKILIRIGTESRYRIAGARDQMVQLDLITADTRDVPTCKSMLGWGRRALSAQLSEQGDEAKARVVEQLCQLAAEKWKPAA